MNKIPSISSFKNQILAGIKKKNKYITVKDSNIHGRGVFAACDIPLGTKIIKYEGDIVEKEEADNRADRDNERGTVYLFTLNDHFDVDGWVNGNAAKFINHSCKPNCEAVLHEDDKCYADDEIWIEAIRDIKKGEELLYMYNFDDPEHECRCGEKNCKGHM